MTKFDYDFLQGPTFIVCANCIKKKKKIDEYSLKNILCVSERIRLVCLLIFILNLC